MFLKRTEGQWAARLALAAATFAAGIGAGAMLAAGPAVNPWSARAAPAAPAAITAISQTAYPAEVMRVIDGDTFEARVRAWPGIEISTKVRLLGIDAPEMRGRCERESLQAKAARDALADMLSGRDVAIRQVRIDKYGGRVLADAFTGSVADVATALLGAGLVRRYEGGRRESWC
jgi:micrococcal nuclease